MPSHRPRWRLARLTQPLAAAVLALLVAGCGFIGGGGSPTDVVRRAVAFVDTKDFEALTQLACAAQRETIREQFNLLGGLGGLGGIAGLDPSSLLDAVDFDTTKVVVSETSVEGDTAEVRMSGTIGLTFDADRAKALIRTVLKQQGQPVDEAQLNLIVGGLGALAQNVPVDHSLTVVRENGSWLICGVAGA